MPRFLIGALLGVFIYQGLTAQAEKTPVAHPFLAAVAQGAALPRTNQANPARVRQLCETDHIALLTWALQNYESRIQDYRLTLNTQERIGGKLLPEQQIRVSFKEQPFSVLMQWQENPQRIDKLLYVEGQNGGKMIVHPSGMLGFIKSVRRSPLDEDVRKSSLRTPDQFGFKRSMQSMLAVYQDAARKNDLQTRCLGDSVVDGRPCVILERLLPAKPEYPFARLVIDFDTGYLLPARVTAYDWQGNLISRYTFTNLEFNLGLTSEMFIPKANNL